jgi:hypothetical protein
MKVAQVGRGRLAENNSCGRFGGTNFRVAAELEVDLFFFEVGLVVRAGIESYDLHDLGF